jgi:hypothetical protein
VSRRRALFPSDGEGRDWRLSVESAPIKQCSAARVHAIGEKWLSRCVSSAGRLFREPIASVPADGEWPSAPVAADKQPQPIQDPTAHSGLSALPMSTSKMPVPSGNRRPITAGRLRATQAGCSHLYRSPRYRHVRLPGPICLPRTIRTFRTGCV